MNTKRIKLILLALLLVLSLSALVGCGGGEEEGQVSGIFIASTDMPRAVYVQGQELDLTRGKLSVVIDGQQSYIPLNHEGVKISGYDPNTLGSQTVTVSYKGKSATFTVAVVQRAVPESYEVNYFIGDTLDLSKGRLRITKDDGTSFTVAFNDPELKVKSFDSSSAGKATATVEYSGKSVSCQCSFEVTVHEPADISLHAPAKTDYANHETELNLGGGYLTVKAASPSTFSKSVPLTKDMVSGYEPAKVTIADRGAPVQQIIKVSYLGRSFEFPIEVSYSTVYLIDEIAKQCSGLDWSGDRTPEISEELGNSALDAVEEYLELSPFDKSAVDKKALLNVVRPATVHLTKVYRAAAAEFSDAFLITDAGYLQIVGESYEAIETAIKNLRDPEDMFNYYAALLNTFREEFGDETMLGDLKISDAIMAHTPETIDRITPMLEHMLSVYDALKDIPEDWTVDTLKDYDLQISVAADKIAISDFVGAGFNELYYGASSWRAKDDYFDIIYAHYFYNRPNGKTEISEKLWGYVPAPGILGEWYTDYVKALYEEQNMAKYADTQAFLCDTSTFMYHYFHAQELSEQIRTGDVELYREIYGLMQCDKLFYDNLTYGPYGYVYHLGNALASDKVNALWSQYVDLLGAVPSDGSDLYEEFSSEIEAVFDSLCSLSPAELNAFVSSINFRYRDAEGNVTVLNGSQHLYSTFSIILNGYYAGEVSDDVYTLFTELLIAMESYSLKTAKETALDDFKTAMKALEEGYGKLSDADRADFDKYFGKAYGNYNAIYKAVNGSEVAIPDSLTELFKELEYTLDAFDRVFTFVSTSTSKEEQSRAMPLIFALYEKASDLHSRIINSGDTKALTALYTKIYTQDGIDYTLDLRFYGASGLTVTLMTGSSLIGENGEAEKVWDIYGNSGIRPLVKSIADIMLAEFDGKVYDGDDVAGAMIAFTQLSPEDKNVFYKMSFNLLYYTAVENYLNAELSSPTLVRQLINAEISLTVYENTGEKTRLKDFKDYMASVIAEHGKLTNTEKVDEYLGSVYEYYLDKYNTLEI
ncbi:MAG: bacterial Ig-like domain-containing protein [Clostridia bacterium]|nr:bacterial Ig-like domain-containing protein [Clostridia bacterium]